MGLQKEPDIKNLVYASGQVFLVEKTRDFSWILMDFHPNALVFIENDENSVIFEGKVISSMCNVLQSSF